MYAGCDILILISSHPGLPSRPAPKDGLDPVQHLIPYAIPMIPLGFQRRLLLFTLSNALEKSRTIVNVSGPPPS